MSRRDRSSVQLEEERKYPDEQRFSDKDDQKQQSFERKKEPRLIEQLQEKFSHTDYSETSGLSPAERLERMSKDANAINFQREELAKAKEKEEDAAWWQNEKLGQSSSVSQSTSTSIPGGDKMADSLENKKPTKPNQLKGVEHEQGILKATRSMGNLPATSWGGSQTEGFESEKRDKLEKSAPIRDIKSVESTFSRRSGEVAQDLSSKLKGDSPTDQRMLTKQVEGASAWGSADTTFRAGSALRSSGPVIEDSAHVLKGGGYVGGDTVRGLWWNTVAKGEKGALDREMQVRRSELSGVESSKNDHSNHPHESDEWRLHNTASVSGGSVTRVKQSASSAYSPVAGGMEDSDVTRTHTRRGSDRVMELPKDGGSQLTQQDFSRNAAREQAARDGFERRTGFTERRQQLDANGQPSDFLESAGHFWSGRPVERDLPLSNRVVLPTYLPPTQSRTAIVEREEESSSAFFERQKEKLSDFKDSIENKLERLEDRIEAKLSGAKASIEDKFEHIKDGAEHYKDEAADKMSEWKNTVVDKSDEFVTTLKGKTEDAREDARDLRSSASRKLRDAKDDVEEFSEQSWQKTKETARDAQQFDESSWKRAELKGEQLVDDMSQKTREWKRDAELKGRELKSDIREDGQKLKHEGESLLEQAKHKLEDVEHGAVDLAHKAADSWWNPLSHLATSGTPLKERSVHVESGPEAVHITRKESEETSVHFTPTGAPHSTEVSAIHVPLSLRGLEGGTDLPAPHMPNVHLKGSPTLRQAGQSASQRSGIYVPNSLRGLEGGTELPAPKLPSATFNAPADAQPIYVPNSLRGLESNGLASEEARLAPSTPVRAVPRELLQELPHPNDERGELQFTERSAGLAPKETHGVMYNMLHMFDRDVARDSEEVSSPRRSSTPSREDKLNASARDFWDLKSQGASPRERSASPMGARSVTSDLSSQLKDGSSQFGSSPSPAILHATSYDWDILHDRQFEELMAETME